ncbi:hypothetical protein AGMMS50249_2800 [candidate division SR1 bacterium]|nr:hypothetical protein AGMMS50249_2800 [candidate division SR1 bacterium]
MKLKTSTKISLKFTLFTSAILIVFSIIVCLLFFSTRYHKQQQRLVMNSDYSQPVMLDFIRTIAFDDGDMMIVREIHPPQHTSQPEGNIVFRSQAMDSKIQEIPSDTFTAEAGWSKFSFISFISHDRVKLATQDNKFYIWQRVDRTIKLIDVTGFAYAQAELMQLILLGGLIFILLVYLISLYFVQSSLKNLKKLTHYVQHLNFEKKNDPLKILGHPNDEIKLITDAFNGSLERIQAHIQSLRDFTANASHELKTPLMMMSTEVDLAFKKRDYEPRLINIKSNIKRLSSLLDTLSLITTLENGKKIEKKQIGNLAYLTQETIDEISEKYDRKIQLTIDQNVNIQAHPELFQMIIRNLIENSCKYAGDDAQISVAISQSSLSVIDTGRGIPDDVQDKIFERFWQGEKTEVGEHSFGLGLYLVERIVKLHGWKIRLESEIGQGSKFIVLF